MSRTLKSCLFLFLPIVASTIMLLGTRTLLATNQILPNVTENALLSSETTPPFTWSISYGLSTTHELIYDVQPTADHGYIAAGLKHSLTGDERKAWVIKLDDLGIIQWQHIYTDATNSEIRTIRQLPDGSYIAAGYHGSTLVGQHPWLLKLDPNGDIAWQKSYQVSGHFNALELTDTGFIAVGSTTAFGGGDASMLIMKLDNSGEILWARAIGGIGGEAATAVKETLAGDFVVAGTNGIGLFYLTWLDGTNGEITWQRNYASAFLANNVADMLWTSDGSFLVMGYGGESGSSNFDIWLVKLNASLEVEWSKTYGGAGDDLVVSGKVIETENGRFVFAARTASFGLTSGAIWLVQVEPDTGTIMGQTAYEGNAASVIGLADIQNSGFIVSGSQTKPPTNESDARLIRLDANGQITNCAQIQNTDATPVMITTTPVIANEPEYAISPTLVITVATAVIAQTQPNIKSLSCYSINGFLDLPLDYSDDTTFEVAALGLIGPFNGQRVNSWFDHQYPNYGKDSWLVSWGGNPQFDAIEPPGEKLVCTNGVTCYDGHNGIDFQPYKLNEQAYAAARGTVVHVFDTWSKESVYCGLKDCKYGNYIVINHDPYFTCYATLYAHLSTISVTIGSAVEQGTPIGVIGTTGNSTGDHLHFGLYRDCSPSPTWPESTVVDPYGYIDRQGKGDPAHSDLGYPRSWYLWKHALGSTQNIGETGGQLTTPSAAIQVDIPAGALATETNLSLLRTMPYSVPQQGLSSLGYSFNLDIVSSIQDNLQSVFAFTDIAFNQPVTITITYQDSETSLLFEDDLALYQWDEAIQQWKLLPSTLDTISNQLTAVTNKTGYFDVQGTRRYTVFIPVVQK